MAYAGSVPHPPRSSPAIVCVDALGGEQQALRQLREAQIADLNRELGEMAKAASDLQERLKSVDPNAMVSVELHN